MTQRIIPVGMREEASGEPEKEVQTARFENVNLDKCPICQNQMRSVEANGAEAMYCDTHSILMPKKD